MTFYEWQIIYHEDLEFNEIKLEWSFMSTGIEKLFVYGDKTLSEVDLERRDKLNQT